MSETNASTASTREQENHYEPGLYEIRIKGHLDDQWDAWFGGLTITLEDNGNTLLAGPVVDQTALHGLLRKVRDLGIQLISVIRVEDRQADTSHVKH
jgi:hypothetical protein